MTYMVGVAFLKGQLDLLELTRRRAAKLEDVDLDEKLDLIDTLMDELISHIGQAESLADDAEAELDEGDEDEDEEEVEEDEDE